MPGDEKLELIFIHADLLWVRAKRANPLSPLKVLKNFHETPNE
jgi:hypothetical protein